MWFCAVFFLLVSSSSCISTKSTTYFNNLPDSVLIKLDRIQPPQPVIQVNDILEIQLGGDNEKTLQYITQHFTTGGASGGGNNSSNGSGGNGGGLRVIVDVNGKIELPQIGVIKVSGLTREALKDTITKAYQEFLVNPIVNVNFGNFRFSILGEVNSPGNFDMPNEKVSIFEALAEAGDLTTYAIRDNVTIIRDINGEREIRRVNLLDKNILNSPDYYLQRYDLLYVEAKPLKGINENLQRTMFYFGFITTTIALIALLTK